MDKNIIPLLDFLGTFVTENKKALIDNVLLHRTRHLTFVLEDIYQPQNASAVVRTCDCFGIQDLHVIEGRHKYEVNPRVVHGASNWVDIHKYSDAPNNTATCFDTLKEQGYKILVTSPDKSGVSIHEMDLDSKIAMVFGTEKSGASKYAQQNADEFVTIPMYGFSESLNLSVCAAICANVLIQRLIQSSVQWNLTEEEKNRVKLNWFRRILDRSEILEKEFLKSIQ